MNTTSPSASAAAGHAPAGANLAPLVVAAFGVVFGDIGTSPLYALRECFSPHYGLTPTPENVLGIVSLMFWALTLVICGEYILVVMRADNRGEGGILALMALTLRGLFRKPRTRWWVVALGLFGAAMFYGDGVITPAISVLSAVEGLEVAAPQLEHFVVPLALTVLILLFAFQHRGTATVGALFGPVMCGWFATLGLLGLYNLVQHPAVLAAINPLHAVNFFLHNGWTGFLVLGSVFLVITGGEALYVDMGHFGRTPIRVAWFSLVLPGIALNYFGQGALILENPETVRNPFFLLAPAWLLYPLVILATLATVIASQAVISGVFSLTRQAVQLGYLPRFTIVHTSSEEIGQIYIPRANWAMLAAVIVLVVGFGSSSALAAAYGISVTVTMVLTTTLTGVVAYTLWNWPLWRCLPLFALFLCIDLSFFTANALKIPDGGWFPLLIAALVFTLMSTWKEGRELLAKRLREESMPLSVLLAGVERGSIHRVPGTAVFLTSSAQEVPHALLHNLKHNKVLHERVVLLTVETEDIPRVAEAERIAIEAIGHEFYRLTVRYGFFEDPNLPRELELCAAHGLSFDLADTTFFLGRETLIATRRPGMALWREKLFVTMSLNAQRAMDFFRLPTNRVVELGAQVEL
ncbi:MAG TPA: potassium transporter Kup [Candidatus Competibacteraceae bacterium]|nr:potassium transporter Kup [Candidatus Competibacteraceae bacterium]